MANDLPRFKARNIEDVRHLLARIFFDHETETMHLMDVQAYPDGHYRAVFRMAYFTLQPGEHEPTKSQWRTLKKKLKRHDPKAFVFKDHGVLACPDESGQCGYIDFGFFAN